MDFYREIGRFKAASENGTVYTVIESQVVSLKDFGFPVTSTRKSYKITTDDDLICVDGNTFKFLLTDEVIKRI